jgi:hypothetical protein
VNTLRTFALTKIQWAVNDALDAVEIDQRVPLDRRSSIPADIAGVVAPVGRGYVVTLAPLPPHGYTWLHAYVREWVWARLEQAGIRGERTDVGSGGGGAVIAGMVSGGGS